jgi:HNH endonuclease
VNTTLEHASVLICDNGGNPKNWATAEEAALYYAVGKVNWETGITMKTFIGGTSSKTGERTTLDISSILGVSGPLLGTKFFSRESKYADRMILYRRDHNLCAYCGEQFPNYKLTIDHIQPKSKGGQNIWTNCVTACKPCNHRKGDKTPEEWGTKLLYIPYRPSIFDKILLKNRNILADQMEFLLPKASKVLQERIARLGSPLSH